jgi:hypothetical protein
VIGTGSSGVKVKSIVLPVKIPVWERGGKWVVVMNIIGRESASV